MSGELIQASGASDTLAALYMERRSAGVATLWCSVTFIGIALAASPFIKVNVGTRATGVVRPEIERVDLRSAVGGIVDELCVSEGDAVAAGDVILRLRADGLEEQARATRVKRSALVKLVADLDRIVAYSIEMQAALDGPPEEYLADHPALQLETPELRSELERFNAESITRRVKLNQATDERRRYEALMRKELVAEQTFTRVRSEEAAKLAEWKAFIEGVRFEWQARLRQERLALDDLVSVENRLTCELDRYVVKAPTEGVIVGMAPLAEGAYFPEGQVICAVSPDGRLVVETLVPSRDAGHLQVGQRVQMQVHAYPYTRWGMLPGRVSMIGADAVLDDGLPVFRVQVVPIANHLRPRNETVCEIRKGMSVTALFVVRRQSIWDSLIDRAAACFISEPAPTPVAGAAISSEWRHGGEAE